MDAEVAKAIEVVDEMRLAANVLDHSWRMVHTTDAQVFNVGGNFALGDHILSTAFHARLEGTAVLADEVTAYTLQAVPFILGTSGGDRAAVRAVADPRFHDAIDTVEPCDPPAVWTAVMNVRPRGFGDFPLRAVVCRLSRQDGSFAGAAEVWVPNLSGEVLGLVSLAAPEYLERVARVARSQRRPSAIVFADLEASTPLARRLSTGSYFTLIRRVMREVDRLIVDNGGLVGRHVGDGLTAFFPAELAGGEAEAARKALVTARALPAAVLGAAATVSGAGEVLVNVAVHWGATVRLGTMLTAARFEVTALGDEVNEAARMEACASGGRLLCSKALIERLDDDDAAALGVDPDASYMTLGDVPGAPDKARRDAPTLAVREL